MVEGEPAWRRRATRSTRRSPLH